MNTGATPNANRLHIGIFGRTNSGKSSLLNGITNQNTAIVSEQAGTTTDPVYKAMELYGVGPVILIDTAGFDDTGALGRKRMDKTREALRKADIAIMIFGEGGLDTETEWLEMLEKQKTPVIAVVNKADCLSDPDALKQKIKDELGFDPILVSARTGSGLQEIREAIIRCLPEQFEMQDIVGHLVCPGDVVLLVTPQDPQAPKGRLILPQVQTLRDLLDHHCLSLCVATGELDLALNSLVKPPALIITDSQVFETVYQKKPPESKITSFSALFARYKGDADLFAQGAHAIDTLRNDSKVLIAEACTHAPVSEDIGREKIPRMLRKKAGEGLHVDIVSGQDFPKDLSDYDLVIHCGACMFNRKLVLSRIEQAKAAGVPMTNYGMAIAKLTGILNKITY